MKKLFLLLAGACALFAAGEIDTSPRRVYVASSLPSTCGIGDSAQNTSQPSGQQWYLCTAPNTWTQQGGSGGGGGGGNANVPTLSVSGTTLNFFTACASTPCSVSRGSNNVDIFTAANSVVSVPSGTGTVWAWWTGSGCVVGSTATPFSIGGSGPCAGTSISASGFPNNVTALIGSVTYGSGAWGTPANAQPTASNPPVINAGPGILSTFSPGAQQLKIDPSTVAPIGGSSNQATSGTFNLDLSQGDYLLLLTGSATLTASNVQQWRHYSIQICQDGTGSHSLTWPAGWHGMGAVTSTASTCSMQQFESLDGATVWAISGLVSSN